MRVLDLVVQAAQDILGGFGVVVLHELALEAGGLLEGPGVEAFEEEAAVVAEDFRFEDDDFGDGGGGGDHLSFPCINVVLFHT